MGRRKKVNTLPIGTVVGRLKILAHNWPEAVYVQCQACSLKSWIIYKNFYSRDACGCTSLRDAAKTTHVATKSERFCIDAMNRRIKAELERYIPIHLRPFWKYRSIDPDWHEDNPDRYKNFIRDVGHKKPGQRAALVDPAGDFNKDNFYWKGNGRGNQRADSSAKSQRDGDLLFDGEEESGEEE